MGDRSNLIIINKRSTGAMFDTLTGLSLYSHWGGGAAQAHALDALATHAGRYGDTGYMNRIITRAFTHGDDGELGSGIYPFVDTIETGTALTEHPEVINRNIAENEHHVVVIGEGKISICDLYAFTTVAQWEYSNTSELAQAAREASKWLSA